MTCLQYVLKQYTYISWNSHDLFSPLIVGWCETGEKTIKWIIHKKKKKKHNSDGSDKVNINEYSGIYILDTLS